MKRIDLVIMYSLKVTHLIKSLGNRRLMLHAHILRLQWYGPALGTFASFYAYLHHVFFSLHKHSYDISILVNTIVGAFTF